MKRALAALVVVLVGCGGGGGGSTTATTTTTTQTSSTADFKQQFAAVDAQLKATGTAVAGVFQSASGQSDTDLASAFDKLSTRLGTLTDKLAQLQPPDDLKDDYAALRKDFDEVHADLDDLVAAARAHDAAKARAATKQVVAHSAAIKATANRIRRALGLKQSP